MQTITPNPAPDVIERHCAKCGNKFNTRHKGQYYCSVPCKRASSSHSHMLASALSAFAAPVATPGLVGLEERLNRLGPDQMRVMQRHVADLASQLNLVGTDRTAAQQQQLHGRRG